MSAERFVALAGSLQTPLPGAQPIAASDPDEQFVVTVYLRPDPAAKFSRDRGQEAERLPGDWLNRRQPEVEAPSGVDPDLSAVAGWASGRGLSVIQQNRVARTLQLAGTVRSFGQAFGVQLQTWRYRGREYRDHAGPLHIPESLSGVVVAVLGLDNRSLESDTDSGRS